jgi:hypothetical protein
MHLQRMPGTAHSNELCALKNQGKTWLQTPPKPLGIADWLAATSFNTKQKPKIYVALE